jgi:chorismate synthase
MKNSFGNVVTLTLFGESHGRAIGAVLDGMAAGIEVDESFIADQMDKRRAVGAISTKRHEADKVEILSGVFNGRTTGTPICFLINNVDTKSAHYGSLRDLMRPGHADYTGMVKYHGFNDYRGGGHFSGRLTAPITAAGALALLALKKKGITVATHISKCAGVCDAPFSSELEKEAEYLNSSTFAVLDPDQGELMKEAITKAAGECDSVGGVLETVVLGMPAGVGEPWFDTIEGLISHALFSIPAVKGVEFGGGFALADMRGSEANDPMRYDDEGGVITTKNNNGGVNGDISNGMPMIFRCAVKPTPSIS